GEDNAERQQKLPQEVAERALDRKRVGDRAVLGITAADVTELGVVRVIAGLERPAIDVPAGNRDAVAEAGVVSIRHVDQIAGRMGRVLDRNRKLLGIERKVLQRE